MDYTVAAVKMTCSMLKEAVETETKKGKMVQVGAMIFQRAWVQGVIVWSSNDHLILDDATDLLHLYIHPKISSATWTPGMYVMVVGPYVIRAEELPILRVHKIVDLSKYPEREAMWYLEVIEAHKLFYEALI